MVDFSGRAVKGQPNNNSARIPGNTKRLHQFKSFKKALKFANKLRLASRSEWKVWASSGK